MIDLNNKKSRKFVALVRNTVEDLEMNVKPDIETLDGLKNIIETKSLTLINVQYLYPIIEIRKQNIDFIKQVQDEYSFNLINEEHIYMEKFVSQFFEWNVFDYSKNEGDCNLSGSISLKEDTYTVNKKEWNKNHTPKFRMKGGK